MNKTFDQFNINTEKLFDQGYIKLDFLSNLIDRQNLISLILEKINGNTFLELNNDNFAYLLNYGYTTILAEKLFAIAKERLGYSGEIKNQYHVARFVKRGNSKEQYRGHFDSHLFTLVTPLMIPKIEEGKTIGELYIWPKARKHPNSELINILGKIYFKRFANKKSVIDLKLKNKLKVFFFEDFVPILFLGNTTFHTNAEVSIDSSSDRLTFLSHYFDPSPNLSVGALLRKIRNR